MSARRLHSGIPVVLVLMTVQAVRADSARESVEQGNRRFAGGEYTEAINEYNAALIERPEALEPKFNKANSYFRLDNLAEALELYQEVATASRDMALVGKAKYNLGNAYFQRGAKQRDADLQEAIDDMKTSITYWRQVLDIDPQNQKAARNIEVARLTIKDILDQLKKQQEQQQQGQSNEKQQQDQQSGQRPQDQPQSQQDSDQPRDPNESQKAAQQQDPNQPQDRQPPEQQQTQQRQEQDKQQQTFVPDTTAQEIIDREQRQKKERERLQQARYKPPEKDW